MEPALLLERDQGVATIAINDAPRNRMSLEFMDALEERLPELDADRSVRAVVFTAAGDENFSVGMDLKQLPQGVQAKGSLDAVFDQRRIGVSSPVFRSRSDNSKLCQTGERGGDQAPPRAYTSDV